MSDPQKCRNREEVAQYEEQDCINRLVNHLVEHDLSTQEEIDASNKQSKAAALEAVRFADQSPDLGTEEMHTDVNVTASPPFREGQLPQMFSAEDE